MNKLFVILASCALLCACAASAAVDLKNASGDTVRCGPFKASFLGDDKVAANSKLQECIKSYEGQGYRRQN